MRTSLTLLLMTVLVVSGCGTELVPLPDLLGMTCETIDADADGIVTVQEYRDLLISVFGTDLGLPDADFQEGHHPARLHRRQLNAEKKKKGARSTLRPPSSDARHAEGKPGRHSFLQPSSHEEDPATA